MINEEEAARKEEVGEEPLTQSATKRISSTQDPSAKRLKHNQSDQCDNRYESMQPRLKKFLKIYQLSSRNSLSGPSELDLYIPSKEAVAETINLSTIANVTMATASTAVDSQPRTCEGEGQGQAVDKKDNKSRKKHSKSTSLKFLKCIQADQDTSQLMDTLLHGEHISCFMVGGEKRLCLHDILNTILKDFSVQEINTACQKLSIACLESTAKQIDILKRNQLLPAGAPNCGLLTQTNSERLCAYLMDSSLSEKVSLDTPPSSTSSSPASHTPTTLHVFHECFGKTYGHLHLNMYARHDSACIECDTCRKLYSPKNFVCHSHKNETYTRHWGFDSTNWRLYLKLACANGATAHAKKSVLADLVISNKDNIAANSGAQLNTDDDDQLVKDKEKMLIVQDEFEMFKQKFCNLEHKVYKSSPRSLTDLNNHFKKSNQHKLLNDLLTKTTDSALLLANQPNLVIQPNTPSPTTITNTTTTNTTTTNTTTTKSSKSKLNQTTTPTTTTPAANSTAYYNMLKCLSKQSAYGALNCHQSKYFASSNSSTIEISMLEFILNEIQLNVPNKESAERLKQMVTQMQVYYLDKIKDNNYINAKYISELEEAYILLST
ncbi:ski oncogene [Brachionus plicatilis]|uniref:Ski oncogene n=1 Tax=Brachionus plicatilis TaxID=10195 RepID=A0A3M7PWK6_BRAPC|nr:ski oncogene [Brachionus plicatilis]